MKRYFPLSCVLIGFFFFSCSKKNDNGPQNNNGIKIELVSGNNQTDTIGKFLANSIVVKVTQGGSPLKNYAVGFQGTGCSSDQMYVFDTGVDGTVGYNWSLAGDVGQQSLKIYALNSQNQKIDSVTATSTALSPGPGWHNGACSIPFGGIPVDFCSISSGRLFTCFSGGLAYLRYSDDNGQSWNAVTSAGKHNFRYVISTPADEVFAFSSDGGVFYSKDAGKTWIASPITPFASATIASVSYSSSDSKLLVATPFNGVYTSTDKGQTWNKPVGVIKMPNSGGPDLQLQSFIEDQDGTLYVVSGSIGNFYKSTDNGNTWMPLNQSQERVYAFYIDKNHWMYKSRFDGDGGIYVSKDNGATYSLWYNSPNSFIQNMSLQPDGNFYFDLLSSTGTLYQATPGGSSFNGIFPEQMNVNIPYIVAKNNNIITANNGNGLLRYYKH